MINGQSVSHKICQQELRASFIYILKKLKKILNEHTIIIKIEMIKDRDIRDRRQYQSQKAREDESKVLNIKHQKQLKLIRY